MPRNSEVQSRTASMPYLMILLSMCLLAASWGAKLGPTWRPIWAYMGLFGIAAAVGLSAIEQTRLAKELEEQKKARAERLSGSPPVPEPDRSESATQDDTQEQQEPAVVGSESGTG